MGIFDHFENASIEKKIFKAEDAIDSIWTDVLSDKAETYHKYDHDFLDGMRTCYLRLREKYKHDRKQFLNILTDWDDYLENIFSISYAAMAMGGGDKDGSMGNSIEEKSASNYEIENRFTSLLDDNARAWLKDYRKKRYG